MYDNSGVNRGKQNDSYAIKQAENVLRTLVNTMGTIRLYQASSAQSGEAVELFIKVVEQAVADGLLRYRINPDNFALGSVNVTGDNKKISALARILYSMQAGELIITPGLTPSEVLSFTAVCGSSPDGVRSHGGLSTVLKKLGITHIGIIGISLNEEDNDEGLLGMDMLLADMKDIAVALSDATEQWANNQGTDTVAYILERLEPALRGLTLDRMASALLRTNEQNRFNMLANALQKKDGKSMKGMLEVFAHLKPLALVRLLAKYDAEHKVPLKELLTELPLSSETLRTLVLIFNATNSQNNVRETKEPNAEALAEEIMKPVDTESLKKELDNSAVKFAHERALSVAISISREYPNGKSVEAIGIALPQALRDGAFIMTDKALKRLDELSDDLALENDIRMAKKSLLDRQLLLDMCAAVRNEYDTDVAAKLLSASGMIGGEVLVDAYIAAKREDREYIQPLLLKMSDLFASASVNRIQQEPAEIARRIIMVLASFNRPNVIYAIARGLRHPSDQVRFQTVTALCGLRHIDAYQNLTAALNHEDIKTQTFAAHEIGRFAIAEMIPQLELALERAGSSQKYFELKKEIVTSLGIIGTPEARSILQQLTNKRFILSSRKKIVNLHAKEALDRINNQSDSGEWK